MKRIGRVLWSSAGPIRMGVVLCSRQPSRTPCRVRESLRDSARMVGGADKRAWWSQSTGRSCCEVLVQRRSFGASPVLSVETLVGYEGTRDATHWNFAQSDQSVLLNLRSRFERKTIVLGAEYGFTV